MKNVRMFEYSLLRNKRSPYSTCTSLVCIHFTHRRVLFAVPCVCDHRQSRQERNAMRVWFRNSPQTMC